MAQQQQQFFPSLSAVVRARTAAWYSPQRERRRIHGQVWALGGSFSALAAVGVSHRAHGHTGTGRKRRRDRRTKKKATTERGRGLLVGARHGVSHWGGQRARLRSTWGVQTAHHDTDPPPRRVAARRPNTQHTSRSETRGEKKNRHNTLRGTCAAADTLAKKSEEGAFRTRPGGWHFVVLLAPPRTAAKRRTTLSKKTSSPGTPHTLSFGVASARNSNQKKPSIVQRRSATIRQLAQNGCGTVRVCWSFLCEGRKLPPIDGTTVYAVRWGWSCKKLNSCEHRSIAKQHRVHGGGRTDRVLKLPPR